MQDNDSARFLALMTGICEYYGKEISKAVISLYWNGLKQFDYPAIEKAFWEHTQNPDTGQFMPKIADIMKMLQGRTTDQASIAWSKVDEAVRRVGTYRDVVFDDPLIHRVIQDMGGWIKLGTIDEKEWPFIERHFQTRYQGYKLRNDVPEYLPSLTGISNAQNAKEGFLKEEPVLLGNKEKAQQVLLGGNTNSVLQIN